MSGNPAFVILATLSTAVFAAGVLGNVMFWLQGAAGASAQPARSPLGLLGVALRGLARPAVWNSLLLDTALQRRLWRLSRTRWLAQIGFIWGTGELFFVGSVGNMLAERGLLPVTKDTPAFALLNELGATLVLVAVGIALYRRFVARQVELATSAGDAALVALLATTVLSGLLVESLRLMGEGSADGGWYSFIGYGLALALRPAAAGLAELLAPVWWLHVVLSFSLMAYLPFSKLFHVFVSPVVLAAGAVER